jgi:hypothetical protein
MIITYGAGGGGGGSEITIEGTLLASGWSSGLQQVTFQGVTEDSVGVITLSSSATAEQRQAAEDAGLIVDSFSRNIVSLNRVMKTPSVDIPVTLHLFPEESNFDGGGIYCSIQFGLPERKSLENTSWSEVFVVSNAEAGESYWAIGDTKSVLINGTVGSLALSTTLYVFIIGFNHNSAKEGPGITFQGFKTAQTGGTDVCLCDSYYNKYQSYNGTKYFQMNHWGTSSNYNTNYNTNYGGWKGCDMRYDILGSTNIQPSGYGAEPTTARVGYDAEDTTATEPVANTLMSALPADLRKVMKPMTIYTDNKGNKSNTAANVTASVDYLPLLAEKEIFGSRTCANQYEAAQQEQYAYYKNGNSKSKYKHNGTSTAASWWERSPHYNSATSFCRVNTSGGASGDGASYSYGLAPCFRV